MSPKQPVERTKQPRRASKPVKSILCERRHHILVECKDESMQRELFELLIQRGASCRLLFL